MKVLFLEVDSERSWAVAALGPGFLASFLRKHGHEAEFLRVPVDMQPAEVIARVRAADPGLLGISLTTRQWLRVRDLVATLRAEVDVPVVAGGLHPTFSPEDVLARPGFDYVCLGEGEEPLLDLARALEAGRSPEGIDNIWVRGGARPKLRRPFEPLDELPFMARDMLDEYVGCYHVNTQRGCPFPCTYCAARMFSDLYDGVSSYGRRRSHQNVLDELFALKAQGPLSYVIFLDDTFTIQHPWVKEFCRVYGRELAVPFSIHARVETVNERMLHQLAEAGCKHITYGVESGSERIRREVMRRPVTNERFREVFRWTREAGIMVTANYMLGLPEETRDDLDATLRLADELDAFDFGYFVFYPYPGTPLFATCREKGYLPDDYLELPANHRRSILSLPTLRPEDVEEYYDRFTALRERVYRARDVANGTGAAATEETAAYVQDSARSG